MEYQKHVFTFENWHEFKEGQKAFHDAASKVADFIYGESGGNPEHMSDSQIEAESCLYEMEKAFRDLKDLFYHAMWCDSTPTIDIASADEIIAKTHNKVSKGMD